LGSTDLRHLLQPLLLPPSTQYHLHTPNTARFHQLKNKIYAWVCFWCLVVSCFGWLLFVWSVSIK
jgi:hypothetical protein